MPGKSLNVITGVGGIKPIEHQERVKILDRSQSQNPSQTNAGSVNGILSSYDARTFSYRHSFYLFSLMSGSKLKNLSGLQWGMFFFRKTGLKAAKKNISR
jgi:hypothetical protein